MTIPLVAFLYLYLLFILLWLIFSIIALYHIIRYGQISFFSVMVTMAYLMATMAVLFLSYEYLSQIDWEVGLTVLQGGFQFFGSSSF